MRGLLPLLIFTLSCAAQEIRTVQVISGLTAPTDIQNAADGSGRLFIVQQNGIIRIYRNGALLATPFLDIRSKTRANGEQGLLGLAFPPNFAAKQRFYVDYTDLNGNTVIGMYRVTSDPNVADPVSETVILTVQQPFSNHNGGQVRFGPDGYLYIGMGDGGSAGDPFNNGQSLGTLLGKLLRIDVESDPGHALIPPDNPFVNTPGARGEIWAYGIRNPWRFSFDRATSDLWIADVGQDAYEEVDFQPARDPGGENYGWNRMEGLHCYQKGCNQEGLTLPVLEYSHAAGNCSITGGFVYRGRGSPGERGVYFYGDYCTGIIWGAEHQGTTFVQRQLLSPGFGITTFGEDEAGELYVANAKNGAIYRIDGSTVPRLTAGGVVNAASFLGGIVPGSLTTIFAAGLRDDPGSVVAPQVPLPTSLDGVRVTVANIAALIYSVSNVNGLEQVTFLAPADLSGGSTASVVVTRNGQASASVDVPVFATQPGVYSIDGTQAVAVHNADYSLVTASNPLSPGEFAFVYVAGLGSSTDVRVTLAGVACPVQYAGLAPGFPGVYQVNFQVPAVADGSQPLVVTASEVSSPAVKVSVARK
jgi:uncharacterized protein (TIGR03437 family)